MKKREADMSPNEYFKILSKQWVNRVQKYSNCDVVHLSEREFAYSGEARSLFLQRRLLLEEESHKFFSYSPMIQACVLVEKTESGDVTEYNLYFRLYEQMYDFELRMKVDGREDESGIITIEWYVRNQESGKMEGNVSLNQAIKTECRKIVSCFQEMIQEKPPYRLPFVTGAFRYDVTHVERYLM